MKLGARISFAKQRNRSTKDWINRWSSLAHPDLFTRQPDCEPRAYAASIRESETLRVGEDLSVRLLGSRIVAQRGMDVVAEFDSPPTELIEALNESFGEACGTITQIYDIADTVEITVC